jgi:alkaline phosphatase D
MAERGFLHGVASGDPDECSAVIWTRYTPGNDVEQVPVEWRLWAAGEFRSEAGRALASPDADFTVRVVVEGLSPATSYRYQFTAEGRQSTTGRFRTLPQAADHVRLAVVTCAKFNSGYFNAYGRLADRQDLDLVVHLGDYIYEAANHPPASQTPGADLGRDFEPDWECRSLDDYRRRYAQYRRDPDLQRMHAAHAIVATIDDHELADNAWAGGADDHDAGRDGPWASRVTAALTAWEEWMPTRRRPGSTGEPIYRALRCPPLVTVALLETRLHRSAPEVAAQDRTELGLDQRAWLHRLTATAATEWMVVASPSLISPLWAATEDADAQFALRTLKLNEPSDGQAFHDLWDAYPRERDDLIDALVRSPARPVVVSGDIHVSVEAELREPGGRTIGPEWAIGSVTSQNLDDKMGWPPRTRSRPYEERVCACLPHIRWCDLDDHGYMVLDCTPERVQAEWWFVDTVRERSTTEWRGHVASVRGVTPVQ